MHPIKNDENSGQVIITEDQGMIDLHTGNELSLEDASIITIASPTRIILLAGDPESGKTTLLASIYQLFEKGPFAGYIFAGSLTLPGFERRCHLSRIESGGSGSDTERTKHSEGQKVLHLRVRKENLTEPIQDLLISDFSGEYFDSAKNSSQECRKLSIIKRADHFVLLLDGKKLINEELQHKVKTDGFTLLRSCVDSGMLGMESHVDILFTKWDLVEASSRKDEVVFFTSQIEATFKDRFKSRIKLLRFFRISARPIAESKLSFGYNLNEVFSEWVKVIRLPKNKKECFEHNRNPSCEFDRYFSNPPDKI